MMTTTIFFLVIAAIATLAHSLPNATSDEKIVGGRPVSIESFPYQVALLTPNNQFFCGGSILSPNYIVTAAHCYFGAPIAAVRVGSSYNSQGGKIVPVIFTVPHPLYNPATVDYDVAMIRLKIPLTFGAGIQPISLTTTEPSPGTLCTVSGWGYTMEGGTASNQLQAVDVSIVSRQSCQNSYSTSAITERMICASAPGKDACQGDSGGPFVSSGKLSGIVSWGNGCARPDFPGVYTNVADKPIMDFINEFLNSPI